MTAAQTLIADLVPRGWSLQPDAAPGTFAQVLSPACTDYRSNLSVLPGLAPGATGPETVEAIHDRQLRASFEQMEGGVFLDHREVLAGDREGLVSTMAFRYEELTLTAMLLTIGARRGVVVASALCADERFADDGVVLEEFMAALPFDALAELACPA
ncbi:MAG: hypothetical protein Q7T55_05140 [Solirubrobacteraceae bacterium]|nr:hypothetical protein [Solirubrobacteraceae bacterium]